MTVLSSWNAISHPPSFSLSLSLPPSFSSIWMFIPILAIRHPPLILPRQPDFLSFHLLPPPANTHVLEDILVLPPALLIPISDRIWTTAISVHWWQCSNMGVMFHNQRTHSWPCFINSWRIGMETMRVSFNRMHNRHNRHKDTKVLQQCRCGKNIFWFILPLSFSCFAYWCNLPFLHGLAYSCTIYSVIL